MENYCGAPHFPEYASTLLVTVAVRLFFLQTLESIFLVQLKLIKEYIHCIYEFITHITVFYLKSSFSFRSDGTKTTSGSAEHL